MRMALRKFRLTASRRRMLATVFIMTSLLMLFLGQQLPHNAPRSPAVSVQRRFNKDENPVEMEASADLKIQEEDLLIKIKEIARKSLESDAMMGKEQIDKASPLNKKRKPIDVKKKKEAIPSKTNDKAAVAVKKDVEEKKQIIKNTLYQPHVHPDRFKFINKKERINLAGPKVNMIPDQVTWRHELDHLTICDATDPFILAIIVSAVPKTGLRDYIRRTWANPRLYPYTKIRSLFILGATTDKVLQDAVDREYAQYSDLIQYNFIDSYRNLTYKSLSWLTWVGRNCPEAQFIAKIDDDVMVNPFHLRAFFESQLKTPPISQGGIPPPLEDLEDNIATTYIYGRYDAVPYPLRGTKWAVTKEEYPEGRYPPFVHGPAYVVGRVAAKLMLKYSPYVPFLKLEDVYTTGLVAHAAQVKHVQINGVINTFKASSKLYNGTQALMEETNPKSRQEAWEGICLYAPVNIAALGNPWT